jgi:hypothetical protein
VIALLTPTRLAAQSAVGKTLLEVIPAGFGAAAQPQVRVPLTWSLRPGGEMVEELSWPDD